MSIRTMAPRKSTLCGLLASALLIPAFSNPVKADVAYVPLTFRTVSGYRPFVDVKLNGKPMSFMVHARASFYAMTIHANAAAAGVIDLKGNKHYGITADGKVSPLGMSKATAESLIVGNAVSKNFPISVFELPQDPPVNGMLGIGWLRDKRVIVDYDNYRLGIPESVEDARREDERLIAQGFVAHKMTLDTKAFGYTVQGTVNGVPAVFQVSTVGETMLDSGFAAKAKIPLGPVVAQYAGPEGAQGDVVIAKRQVAVRIGDQEAAPYQPLIYDQSGYSSGEEAGADADLAGDFMLANQAVIDFATETLLIKRR